MESIKLRINQKNPDHVQIRYYPDCRVSGSIITVNNVNNNDKKYENMKKRMLNMKKKHEIFTEYGIKDTFSKIINSQQIFFRREQYLFTCEDGCGMFVIELYSKCDEDEFPQIVDYCHNVSYTLTSFIHDKLNHVFSKIKNNQKSSLSKNQRVPFVTALINTEIQHHDEIEIFDINSEIDIKNFDKSLNEFMENINSWSW